MKTIRITDVFLRRQSTLLYARKSCDGVQLHHVADFRTASFSEERGDFSSVTEIRLAENDFCFSNSETSLSPDSDCRSVICF